RSLRSMDEARVMRGRLRGSRRTVGLLVPILVLASLTAPGPIAGAAAGRPTGPAFDASTTLVAPSRAAAAAAAPGPVARTRPAGACCPASTTSASEGGQMDAVAVDPTNPSIVYVAGEGGGIWRSTNAGSSWFRASNGLATGETNVGFAGPDPKTVPTGTLAVDPSTPARLLYGAA